MPSNSLRARNAVVRPTETSSACSGHRGASGAHQGSVIWRWARSVGDQSVATIWSFNLFLPDILSSGYGSHSLAPRGVRPCLRAAPPLDSWRFGAQPDFLRRPLYVVPHPPPPQACGQHRRPIEDRPKTGHSHTGSGFGWPTSRTITPQRSSRTISRLLWCRTSSPYSDTGLTDAAKALSSLAREGRARPARGRQVPHKKGACAQRSSPKKGPRR